MQTMDLFDVTLGLGGILGSCPANNVDVLACLKLEVLIDAKGQPTLDRDVDLIHKPCDCGGRIAIGFSLA